MIMALNQSLANRVNTRLGKKSPVAPLRDSLFLSALLLRYSLVHGFCLCRALLLPDRLVRLGFLIIAKSPDEQYDPERRNPAQEQIQQADYFSSLFVAFECDNGRQKVDAEQQIQIESGERHC